MGTDAQCGGPGTGGSRIVSAEWVDGLGLPDNILIANDDTSTAARRDPRRAILLSKGGQTSNCSAPGDYRNGTHCGAGAPRFNVVLSGETFVHFGGCVYGTHTPAP